MVVWPRSERRSCSHMDTRKLSAASKSPKAFDHCSNLITMFFHSDPYFWSSCHASYRLFVWLRNLLECHEKSYISITEKRVNGKTEARNKRRREATSRDHLRKSRRKGSGTCGCCCCCSSSSASTSFCALSFTCTCIGAWDFEKINTDHPQDTYKEATHRHTDFPYYQGRRGQAKISERSCEEIQWKLSLTNWSRYLEVFYSHSNPNKRW